jgi:hypothetical protein
MNLSITEGEKEMLVDLLQRHIGETRVEIRHTFSHEFKENLRKEEIATRALMEKVKTLAEAA